MALGYGHSFIARGMDGTGNWWKGVCRWSGRTRGGDESDKEGVILLARIHRENVSDFEPNWKRLLARCHIAHWEQILGQQGERGFLHCLEDGYSIVSCRVAGSGHLKEPAMHFV